MKRSYLSRKDSIILTAIEIIDELGLTELSIREIAKRQNVSEPSIYRHFINKQALIIAILDYFSCFDQLIKKTIISLKAKEGIYFYIKSYSEYYENYPPITAIMFAYDTLKYYRDEALYLKNIMVRRTETLTSIVEEGQKRGEIDRKLTAEEIVNIIEGAFKEIVFKWRLSKYAYSLKEKELATTGAILSLL